MFRKKTHFKCKWWLWGLCTVGQGWRMLFVITKGGCLQTQNWILGRLERRRAAAAWMRSLSCEAEVCTQQYTGSLRQSVKHCRYINLFFFPPLIPDKLCTNLIGLMITKNRAKLCYQTQNCDRIGHLSNCLSMANPVIHWKVNWPKGKQQSPDWLSSGWLTFNRMTFYS